MNLDYPASKSWGTLMPGAGTGGVLMPSTLGPSVEVLLVSQMVKAHLGWERQSRARTKT